MSEKKKNPDCPCTYPCPRNGICEECIKYHHRTGSKTACGK